MSGLRQGPTGYQPLLRVDAAPLEAADAAGRGPGQEMDVVCGAGGKWQLEPLVLGL